MNMATQLLAQGAAVQPPPQTMLPSLFGRFQFDSFWQFIVNISWLQAVFAVAFGIIYLVYGWRVFKVLVVINLAIIGLFLGKYVGALLGSPLWGAIVGTFILGVFSWSFMKYAVAVLGGIAGAILGAALWRTGGLPDHLLDDGALVGLIAGGFLAFSSFRMSIMFFTSLQGSAFVVIGALALLNDYPDLGFRVTSAVQNSAYILPLLVLIPTFGGILFQKYLLSNEESWAMPE